LASIRRDDSTERNIIISSLNLLIGGFVVGVNVSIIACRVNTLRIEASNIFGLSP